MWYFEKHFFAHVINCTLSNKLPNKLRNFATNIPKSYKHIRIFEKQIEIGSKTISTVWVDTALFILDVYNTHTCRSDSHILSITYHLMRPYTHSLPILSPFVLARISSCEISSGKSLQSMYILRTIFVFVAYSFQCRSIVLWGIIVFQGEFNIRYIAIAGILVREQPEVI